MIVDFWSIRRQMEPSGFLSPELEEELEVEQCRCCDPPVWMVKDVQSEDMKHDLILIHLIRAFGGRQDGMMGALSMEMDGGRNSIMAPLGMR